MCLHYKYGEPLPVVLKEKIMDPIGASSTGDGMDTMILL
jgi:hypothetical protein